MTASQKSADSAPGDPAGGSSKPQSKSASDPIEDEDSLGGALARQVEELDGLIRENPLAAVGIAAGLGLLLGLMLGRR